MSSLKCCVDAILPLGATTQSALVIWLPLKPEPAIEGTMNLARFKPLILYYCSIFLLGKIVSSFLETVNYDLVDKESVICGKIRYLKYLR